MKKQYLAALGFFGGLIVLIAILASQADRHPYQPYVSPVVPRDSVTYKSSIPKNAIAYHIAGDGYKEPERLYILIDPPNFADNKFKDDIKAIIKDDLADFGDMLIIQFSDSQDTLRNLYNVDKFPESLASKEDMKAGAADESTHLIATYTGNLNPNIPDYANTIIFFPSAFTTTPKVGKLKETISYP